MRSLLSMEAFRSFLSIDRVVVFDVDLLELSGLVLVLSWAYVSGAHKKKQRARARAGVVLKKFVILYLSYIFLGFSEL